MKNADMPAMPQSATNEGHPCNYYDYGGPGVPTGLTKREMMAMHMMAARVSIPGAPDDEFDAKRAVAATDALLAELERTCHKT